MSTTPFHLNYRNDVGCMPQGPCRGPGSGMAHVILYLVLDVVYLAMPPWVLPCMTPWYYLAWPPWVHPRHVSGAYSAHGTCHRSKKSAMGSKKGLIQAGKGLEVNLSKTIWLLAANLGPCCKNQPCQKAPQYLRLSIPCRILSRMGTLP